jgi:hypothetical protein
MGDGEHAPCGWQPPLGLDLLEARGAGCPHVQRVVVFVVRVEAAELEDGALRTTRG